jgi:hypothetical protein
MISVVENIGCLGISWHCLQSFHGIPLEAVSRKNSFKYCKEISAASLETDLINSIRKLSECQRQQDEDLVWS